MLLCVPLKGNTLSRAPLCDQLTHSWHEFYGHLHRSVRRRLVGGLILSDRLLIGLRLVVLQNATNALLVPTIWICRLPHCCLLRRRRSALSALGPSRYAELKVGLGLGRSV